MSVPLQQTSVTRMLHATIPRDLTTALVKMDLKATAKTAQVRFCLEHRDCKELSYRRRTYRNENPFWLFYYHSCCMRMILAVSLGPTQGVARKVWKIQAWTGTRTLTSPMPVQCSTNGATKPTGKWPSRGSIIRPYMMNIEPHRWFECMKFMHLNCGFESLFGPKFFSLSRFYLSSTKNTARIMGIHFNP